LNNPLFSSVTFKCQSVPGCVANIACRCTENRTKG